MRRHVPPKHQLIFNRLHGDIEFFFSNLPNPSGRAMALRSIQPLTEMSTRNLKKKNLGVKGSRRVGLTIFPPSVSRLSK
jgi:hypothetical protein